MINASVLMSVYIKEDPVHFDMALESLFNQTNPAAEIIIVQDGPLTSELTAVINKWCNKLPIKLIPLQENVGLGKALNQGLIYCSYDYIFRCDSDDINHTQRFEVQYCFLIKNPEISIISSAIEEFESDIGDIKRVKYVPNTHLEIQKFICYRNPINHMASAFKKSAINAVGGYRHFPFMEDYDLWLRLLAKGYIFSNISSILVYARVGNGMLTRRKGFEYLKSEYKLYKNLKFLKLSKAGSSELILLLRLCARISPKFIFSKIYTSLRHQTK